MSPAFLARKLNRNETTATTGIAASGIPACGAAQRSWEMLASSTRPSKADLAGMRIARSDVMDGSHWADRHPRLTRSIARIPRRTGIVLLAIALVLVAARIAAPFAIKEVLNRKL